MSKKLSLVLGILIVIGGVLAASSLFTVHQTQHAIVLQFGAIKRVISEPGLSIKIPFIQEVRFIERRVLNLDPPVLTILLADQRRLQVDSFVRYRIVDPELFIRVAGNEAQLGNRLGSIVNDSVRSVLGGVTLATVLTEDRRRLMQEISASVNVAGSRFGIEIVDVRIGRADLSAEVSEAVYRRMRAERERDAAEFRAQGQELYQRITSAADREATVIIAEATRESETLRGQGEGSRTEILNDAYGQDPDFFRFYRTMQAYEGSLEGESSYMVLSTDNEFFEFFDDVVRDEGLPAPSSGTGQ